MAKDKVVVARAKAFSGYPVGTYKFSVDPDGLVRVYDSTANHYTLMHALTDAAQKRIRKLARSQ